MLKASLSLQHLALSISCTDWRMSSFWRGNDGVHADSQWALLMNFRKCRQKYHLCQSVDGFRRHVPHQVWLLLNIRRLIPLKAKESQNFSLSMCSACTLHWELGQIYTFRTTNWGTVFHMRCFLLHQSFELAQYIAPVWFRFCCDRDHKLLKIYDPVLVMWSNEAAELIMAKSMVRDRADRVQFNI